MIHRTDRYLDYLAAVPLFSGCTNAELRSIARRTTDIPVPEGRALVKEGHGGYEFFVVVEGKAEVSRAGRFVAHLGPGDFFGELALLDPAPRDATVTAVTPMEIIVLSRAEFEAALREAPGMTRALLAGMARRLRRLDEQT
jgi:CRP/FNR family transcriptional regulator, cyclic AMP receptor protein